MPNVAKARERLNMLRKRGRVTRLGVVYLSSHPELLWSIGHIPQTLWQHEAEVAEVVQAINPEDVCRIEVEYDADADLTIDGERYFLEMHRGTMKPSEMATRMKRYEGCPHDVLWVCHKRSALEALKALAEDSEVAFWFALYRELLADPRGEVWGDKVGGKSAIGSGDKPANT